MLDENYISYFKEESHFKKGKKPLGTIRLDQVSQCEYLENRRVGSRFDIYLHSSREYQFHGETISEAMTWVDAIRYACHQHQFTSVAASITGDIFPETTSNFRRAFLRNRYGVLLTATDLSEEELKLRTEVMKEADTIYATDNDILQFVMKELMDLSKNHLVYSTDLDNDVALDPSESKEAEGKAAVADPAQFCGSSVVYRELVIWLVSKESVRLMCELFNSGDLELHQMVLRVLWVIFRATLKGEAMNAFSSRLAIHCSGTDCNTRVKDALLHILLSKPEDVACHDLKALRIGFHVKVQQPATWLPIFACLCNTDFDMRLKILQDINTVLIDNYANARSIMAHKGWQKWIFALLIDLGSEEAKTEPVKTLFQFVLNVPTTCLMLDMLKSPDFKRELISFFDELYLYGGQTMNCIKLASNAMFVLVQKVSSNKGDFRDFEVPEAEDEEEDKQYEWENLIILLKFLRRFVFQSSFLQTNKYLQNVNVAEERATYEEEGLSFNFEQFQKVLQVDQDDMKRRASVLMEIRDEKLPEDWLLVRYSPPKGSRTFADEIRLEDNMPHFESHGEGACLDIKIVRATIQMMKAFRFHDFDPECSADMPKVEKDFMQSMQSEFEFWEDSLTLLNGFNRNHIEQDRAFTYRKLSFTLSAWGTAGKKERQNTITWLQKKIKKRRDKQYSVSISGRIE